MNKPCRFISRESLGSGEIDLEGIKRYYAADREKQRAVEKLQADFVQLRPLSPFLAVTFICKAIGYEAYLKEYAGEHDRKEKKKLQKVLEWVQQDAAEYRSTEAWLLSLEERGLTRQNGQRFKKEEPQSDEVTILTMHGAKGLEYDTVFLPNIIEGTVPYGKLLSKEEEEEERRIFYVAMTRAKTRLVMTYTEQEGEKPSHFLSGLL